MTNDGFDHAKIEQGIRLLLEGIGEDPDPYHFIFLDFVVTVLDPDREPFAGDDAVEASWVRFDELSELRLVPRMYEFLQEHEILA